MSTGRRDLDKLVKKIEKGEVLYLNPNIHSADVPGKYSAVGGSLLSNNILQFTSLVNSGFAESWAYFKSPGNIVFRRLLAKLTDKKYGEIESRMRDFASKMPEPDEAIKQLEDNADDYRTLEYSKDNWEKEFPGNETLTSLGKFSFGKDFYNKLAREKREDILGVIKPTIQNPEYIIVDKDYGVLFLKGFKSKKGLIFQSVLKYIDDRQTGTKQEMIVTSGERKPNNIKGKIETGKLQIYSRSELLRRLSDNSSSSFQFTDAVGHLNFANSNIQNDEPKSNPLTGSTSSPQAMRRGLCLNRRGISCLRRLLTKLTDLNGQKVRNQVLIRTIT